MSTVLEPERQYPLFFTKTLTLAELASECVIAKLPPRAVITEIKVYVDTAFNAATTNTLSIGDAGSATRFLNAQSISAVGPVAVTTEIGRKYTVADYLRATYAQSGAAASAGIVRIFGEYIIEGKSSEVQP